MRSLVSRSEARWGRRKGALRQTEGLRVAACARHELHLLGARVRVGVRVRVEVRIEVRVGFGFGFGFGFGVGVGVRVGEPQGSSDAYYGYTYYGSPFRGIA